MAASIGFEAVPKRGSVIKLARLACWVVAVAVLFGAWPGLAGEGGGSNYLQGTYGDWQSAIFGPPGLYYRDDLFRYNASIGARPLGGASPDPRTKRYGATSVKSLI